MAGIRKRLSYANVMATLAVFFVLGGGAYALKKNSVGTKQLKNNAVTSKKIKKNAVTAKKIKKNAVKSGKIKDGAVKTSKIADGAVDGSKVADDSIGDSKLSDVEVFGDSFVKVTATNGATETIARNNAPETTLFTKGALSITAKCFRDAAADETHGEIYGATTQAGSILRGNDTLDGGASPSDYLTPSTDDIARQLDTQGTAGGADANYSEDEYALGAADGTSLIGETAIAVKNGTLAGGQGPYGAGNVCLFQGDAHG